MQLVNAERLRQKKANNFELNYKKGTKNSKLPESKESKTTSFLHAKTSLNNFNVFAEKKKDQSFNQMFKASPINVGLDKTPVAEK